MPPRVAGRVIRLSERADGVAVALLGFAAAITILLIVPAYLRDHVGSVPGFTWQEAVDLLTPVVSLPLLALAIELTGRSSTRTRIAFVVLAAAWAAGQGMHLAANAIGDIFPAGPERDAFYATPVGALDHFLDEALSHWLWHVPWVGLLGVLLWVGAAGRIEGVAPRRGPLVLAAFAGLLHGFTWFVVTDEGETWALAIPATVVLLRLALWLRGRDGPGRVVTTFLVLGSLVTLGLYAAWIGLAGWPPQSLFERFGS